MTTAARAPFLDFASFSSEEVQLPTQPVRTAAPARSPFLSVYEFDDGENAPGDPLREAHALLVDELHDEEFDEALFELQCRGRAMHDEQLAAGRPRAEADRLVTQHFSQLIRESEAMVDAMAREFAPREQDGLVDNEIDTFLENYAPASTLEPEFEHFIRKLAGKLGRAAKAIGRGVVKIGLGPAFGVIKRAANRIIRRVLEWAIGKLPADLQPVAQRLAQKLGFGGGKPALAKAASAAAQPPPPADSAGSPVQDAAGVDDVSPQQELDEAIAAGVLANDEVELELEAAQSVGFSGATAIPAFADLEDARERFIDELEALADDESAAPAIQNFLPAVLPALRIGLRLAGRPKVVNYLAQLWAGMIARLVGPQHSQALSRAIADAGLKLMSLEMSEAETTRLAPAAVAATIEETLGRVASLPDEVLDQQELLQGYALEAFEQAAAANLPAVFPQATYRHRPDLLEGGVDAGWVLLPRRGPKRYKRCTRSFRVTVSPHVGREVESFEGATLGEHLQDQLGLEDGEQVEAELHLYEALPGSSVADIAHGEHETLGPGMSDEANAAQLHPLTPRAAAVLLGKPALGRPLPAGISDQHLPAGQRLFHLATGRRPLMVPGHGQRPRLRRKFHVNVALDMVRDQVRVSVFISEVQAQRLAARLRQGANLGATAAGFQRAIRNRLGRIFGGRAPARLRIVHAALRPGLRPASALQNLPPVAAQAFVTRLETWLVQAFSGFIKAQAQRLIAVTEDAADGVTLAFTVEHPPGLKPLGLALAERGAAGPAIAEAINLGGAPSVRVDAIAGHRCG